MSSLGARVASYMEERYRTRPLAEYPSHDRRECRLRDGTVIAVAGGGLAGPAFARRVLALAAECGVHVRVELLTRPNCNYCAGLITDLALASMRGLYGLEVPADITKETIGEVVYMSRRDSVAVPMWKPLTSVLRTSRFKQRGFDDSWLEMVLKGMDAGSDFTVHRDASIVGITDRAGGFRIAYDQDGARRELDADIVVLATGLKSLQQPFMREFAAEHGYHPPGLMDACVTEINTTGAEHYDLAGRVLVVDGVIPNCIAAFIPKGKGWLTITGLGKVLADHDLEVLFNQPLVQRYIRMDQVIERLRCRKICSASVTTLAARDFFGDGWVMIGDLTGCGRVLKDGYFAALQSADLAARTLMFHGATEQAFREHYLKPLRTLGFDNRVGMSMFQLDQRTSRGRIEAALLSGALGETRREKYGGFMIAAFRGLFSGEISYKLIGALLLAGLITDPIRDILPSGGKVDRC